MTIDVARISYGGVHFFPEKVEETTFLVIIFNIT